MNVETDTPTLQDRLNAVEQRIAEHAALLDFIRVKFGCQDDQD